MSLTPPSDGSPPSGPDDISSVRELIATRQIRVALQPIVDLTSRTVLAHEALVRSTSREFRTPREMFIAAARSGCCGEAVAAAPDQALFLNIHPNELHEGWLLELDDPIYRHPADVYLEITESVPLSHFRQCRQVLQEIREHGIRVVIDDLGAGYSNLRYIADLHPHMVKLDRALVTGLGRNGRMQRLVSSIVALCENLGAEVVAEGVETVEELLAVRDAGIRYVQGYLLARPAASAPEVHWPSELDEPSVPGSGQQSAPPLSGARASYPEGRLVSDSAAPISGVPDSARSAEIAISVRPAAPVTISHVEELGTAVEHKKAAKE